MAIDWHKPTVQMLGRWQPWHKGHRALFERLVNKMGRDGQVCIMVRNCQDENNPFNPDEVIKNIRADLDPMYSGRFEVLVVPNIVHIGYGRKVGYTIEQEEFDGSVEAISATAIRESMNV